MTHLAIRCDRRDKKSAAGAFPHAEPPPKVANVAFGTPEVSNATFATFRPLHTGPKWTVTAGES